MKPLHKPATVRVGRFMVVTSLGYLLYIVLVLSLRGWLRATGLELAASVISVVVTWQANRLWTFGDRPAIGGKDLARQASLYLGSSAAAFIVINVGLTVLLYVRPGGASTGYFVAALTTCGVAGAALQFVLLDRIVFRNQVLL